MVLTRHAGKPKKIDDPEGFGSFRSNQLIPQGGFRSYYGEEEEDNTEQQDENMFDIQENEQEQEDQDEQDE
jgi:hypothetical protein